MPWTPPGKNCGACGSSTCEGFVTRVHDNSVSLKDCPYYSEDIHINVRPRGTVYNGIDVVGQEYDFIVTPLPGEPSARKIVMPFRPDLTEKYGIKKGDIVVGRPAGPGCPVQHVIRVIEADYITGVISGHVVGPSYSRGKDFIDLKMYHMLAFEGMADVINREPQFGHRQFFLPGMCMLHRAHTGLVSSVIKRPYGLQVRVDDIRILG
ncbi:MAG: Fe-S cluster protein [Candidatus Methanoplasma sp.]|jgi:uncharacterized Fe-S cluster-containing protein|nr:Fe-S cluster protein [Candidatus Methanoplasma sp.]